MAEAEPGCLDVVAMVLVHLKGDDPSEATDELATGLWGAVVPIAEEEAGPERAQPLRGPKARQECLGREVRCQET